MMISEAAEALGLNKSTVSRQAREWGIVGPDGLVELDQYKAERSARLSKALRPAGASEERVPLSIIWPVVHQLRDELLSGVRVGISDPVEAAACEAQVSAALARFAERLVRADAGDLVTGEPGDALPS